MRKAKLFIVLMMSAMLLVNTLPMSVFATDMAEPAQETVVSADEEKKDAVAEEQTVKEEEPQTEEVAPKEEQPKTEEVTPAEEKTPEKEEAPVQKKETPKAKTAPAKEKDVKADEETEEYTVTYISEGKTFETQTVEAGQQGEIIHVMPARDGVIFDYVFCGWSTNKNASPTSSSLLKPGDTFDVEGDMTLYAIWGEYEWGQSLHAAGNGTTYVYDGNPHRISGVLERPDKDRKSVTGENYSTGYFYQPLWYSLNVWRYTQFTNIYAERTDVGSKTTPTQGQVFAEIWRPWPWDNSWVLVEDTFTQIWPATIHITAAPLTVTAPDMKEKYTGEAITPEGTLDGLVTPDGKEQETATLKMDSFTAVGEHPMTYTIEWGTAKKTNYEVTEENLGTLTIYYELAFDANGGEGAPETMEVTSDTATLPSDEPTREGYTFKGWAESESAEKADYQPGETIRLNDNTTLYAVWESNERTITYNLNGGTYKGSKADIVETYQAGDEITIHEAPTREGYEFVEWQGSSYQPGDKYKVSDNHVFTAKWKKTPKKEVKTASPKTGDHTDVYGPIALICISIIAMAALVLMRKREQI